MSIIVVLSTCQSQAEAEKITQAILTNKLAACVNILPSMHSIYLWQGAIDHMIEFQMIIKTTSDKYSDLEKLITTLHSYDTPEIIAIPATQGSPAYFKWLEESLL